MRITTPLQPRGPAAAIVLTDAQRDEIGDGRKAFPVTVTIDATTIEARAARMGGETLVGFSRAARATLGVEIGETVDAEILLDDGPREVTLPTDLATALAAHPAAAAAFEALAPSHRKGFATWVDEAKRPQTRQRRVTETLAMLRAGRTR